ncbi:hypothetical protein IWZ03DRAFT_374220 [Phyllosticta citriasiana]|uniref:Uncharacterized protein n=1 Tax=Phyllosticta citriasiana TaxID=595635 RepID=A0ABR1KTI7_9PEZI
MRSFFPNIVLLLVAVLVFATAPLCVVAGAAPSNALHVFNPLPFSLLAGRAVGALEHPSPIDLQVKSPPGDQVVKCLATIPIVSVHRKKLKGIPENPVVSCSSLPAPSPRSWSGIESQRSTTVLHTKAPTPRKVHPTKATGDGVGERHQRRKIGLRFTKAVPTSSSTKGMSGARSHVHHFMDRVFPHGHPASPTRTWTTSITSSAVKHLHPHGFHNHEHPGGPLPSSTAAAGKHVHHHGRPSHSSSSSPSPSPSPSGRSSRQPIADAKHPEDAAKKAKDKDSRYFEVVWGVFIAGLCFVILIVTAPSTLRCVRRRWARHRGRDAPDSDDDFPEPYALQTYPGGVRTPLPPPPPPPPMPLHHHQHIHHVQHSHGSGDAGAHSHNPHVLSSIPSTLPSPPPAYSPPSRVVAEASTAAPTDTTTVPTTSSGLPLGTLAAPPLTAMARGGGGGGARTRTNPFARTDDARVADMLARRNKANRESWRDWRNAQGLRV